MLKLAGSVQIFVHFVPLVQLNLPDMASYFHTVVIYVYVIFKILKIQVELFWIVNL